LPIPAGTAFRDFSSLLPYSGNPIIPQNTAAYNVNGVTNSYFDKLNVVASTYYATGSGDASGGLWNSLILYSSTGILNPTPTAAIRS